MLNFMQYGHAAWDVHEATLQTTLPREAQGVTIPTVGSHFLRGHQLNPMYLLRLG